MATDQHPDENGRRADKSPKVWASHPHLTISALMLIMILLLAADLWWSARGQSDIQQRLSRLEKSLASQLTTEQEARIREIRRSLEDQSRWPTTLKDAASLRENLAKLVEGMSPGAQIDHLPRLLPLQWGVEAIWTIRQGEESPDSAPAVLAESLASLLEREPDQNPFESLHVEVEKKRGKADEDAKQKERGDVIHRARSALKGDGDPTIALEGLSNIVHQDAETETLRTSLKAKILGQVTDEKIKLLRETLNRSCALDTDRLRQAGLARVQDAAISLLLDLETEQKRPEDLLRRVRELVDESQKALDGTARHQQEDLTAKVRNYQKWALAQIKEFNDWPFDRTLSWVQNELKEVNTSPDEDWPLLVFYPWSKNVIQDKLGIPMQDVEGACPNRQKRKDIYDNLGWPVGWKNGIDQEIAHRAIRERMIRYLLPINPSLLDPPVAQLYQKAFTKGWEKLEGRPDQLEVAKATISVIKKPLE